MEPFSSLVWPKARQLNKKMFHGTGHGKPTLKRNNKLKTKN
jgi:hypothetical protein